MSLDVLCCSHLSPGGSFRNFTRWVITLSNCVRPARNEDQADPKTRFSWWCPCFPCWPRRLCCSLNCALADPWWRTNWHLISILSSPVDIQNNGNLFFFFVKYLSLNIIRDIPLWLCVSWLVHNMLSCDEPIEHYLKPQLSSWSPTFRQRRRF